ncbi:methylthioadenosine phosphorylase [Jatrophihabitans sp. GAS493]|uniref:S-methyl-5'-thioadenosine phosphorylase n=1 Tax=Jatrophihabitans sp. GAS493 TaxID=1907575 RepID=UPI000BC0D10D|nr:S-methyl-5'-thioadenosine phosphorylase [Jatrophihabitans sp. GAS493]SOD72033.1 methylthioadenosine phosphorylase [Jatrophihabitans sp. GAS493]
MTNSPAAAADLADVGVIGGSGFYSLLADAHSVAVSTPFGEPSAELTIGTFAGRRVAFLPRHGVDHRFAPHLVPYRANLWALRSVGVRQVVSLSAVGSLKAELGTGTLVVPDQLADRTYGRPATFVRDGAGVAHISLADPYCARGRAAALNPGAADGGAGAGAARVVDGGVLVVINGPRFSTRAESLEYQSHGWSIIGMTGMPEAILARELALCYTTLALVTDLDAGVEAGAGVTHGEVLAAFARNLPSLRDLLATTLTNLPISQGDCACGAVYADVPAPYELP